MRTTNIGVLILISIVFLDVPEASPNSFVYEPFIQCLKNQTKQNNITDIVFAQTNASYTSVLRAYIRNSRFNVSTTPKPLIIITPKEDSHVQGAVICSKQVGYQLKIRSGGHDYEGVSYVSEIPFFVLDMFNMRTITIDVKEQTAWVGCGATLGEFYYRIWEKSKTLGFPGGICPTVGVGGYFSGGGYGNMVRKYGLSVDNLVDAKMVDVQGRVLDRKTMGEDLFWAIRGGGGASFGVILAYKAKLVPVPEKVTVFKVMKPADVNGTQMVYKWQLVAPNTDNNLFMRMLVQPRTINSSRTVMLTVNGQYLGDANSVVTLLRKEFPELGLKLEDCQEMPWINSALWWANFENNTSPNALLDRQLDTAKFGKRKSDFVQKPIPISSLNLLWKKILQIGSTGLVFNSYGGRMNDIPESETPFPHRAGNLFLIQYSVTWSDAGVESLKNFTTQAKALYDFMTPFVAKNPRSSFLCYRDLDVGVNHNGKDSFIQARVYGEKYYKKNFDRLVQVKSMVDPHNFFWTKQSIPLQPK